MRGESAGIGIAKTREESSRNSEMNGKVDAKLTALSSNLCYLQGTI
jgi:hypothetical protein